MKIASSAFITAVCPLYLATTSCSADLIRPLGVPVARYSIAPDHSDDGGRIMVLLLKHRIRAVASPVSKHYTVTVAGRDAESAGEVVAFAIRHEKLLATPVPAQPNRQPARKPKSQ